MKRTDSRVGWIKHWFPEFEFTWLGEEMRENLPKEMDFVHEKRNAERAVADFENVRTSLYIRKPKFPTSASAEHLILDHSEGQGSEEAHTGDGIYPRRTGGRPCVSVRTQYRSEQGCTGAGKDLLPDGAHQRMVPRCKIFRSPSRLVYLTYPRRTRTQETYSFALHDQTQSPHTTLKSSSSITACTLTSTLPCG